MPSGSPTISRMLRRVARMDQYAIGGTRPSCAADRILREVGGISCRGAVRLAPSGTGGHNHGPVGDAGPRVVDGEE